MMRWRFRYYILCTINSDTYHIKVNNKLLLTLFTVDKSEIENYVSVYGLRNHEIFNEKPVSYMCDSVTQCNKV